MFTNPIQVSDGTNTHDYEYRGSNINESSYKEAAAPLDQPAVLSIRHQTSQLKSVNQTRRSVYRFDRVVEDAQGNQGTISAYLVLVVPEKVATTAQVTEELAKMTSFLGTSGVSAKIVAAEL